MQLQSDIEDLSFQIHHNKHPIDKSLLWKNIETASAR